jgi:hypothetical protein
MRCPALEFTLRIATGGAGPASLVTSSMELNVVPTMQSLNIVTMIAKTSR